MLSVALLFSWLPQPSIFLYFFTFVFIPNDVDRNCYEQNYFLMMHAEEMFSLEN